MTPKLFGEVVLELLENRPWCEELCEELAKVAADGGLGAFTDDGKFVGLWPALEDGPYWRED